MEEIMMSEGASENVAKIATSQLIAAHMSRLTSPNAPHLAHFNARSVDLERCCPLDSTRHSAAFALPPANTLGALDLLTPELSTQALLYVDLSTLTAFRRVNQCTGEFIDSLYQYHDITTHAPTVLRATLASTSASWITLPKLHSVPTNTHKCSTCGDFGAFLSLFTCTRTCYLCASCKTGLHPLKPCQAKVRYALDTPSWEALHRVKIVPGQYTPEKPDPAIYASKRKRYTLVDRLEAIRAGVVKLHGSMRKMYKVVASRHRNLRTKPDQAGLRGSSRACLALGHMSLDLKSNNPHRFMGIVRAPWINRQPRITAEWGFFCKACLPCVTPDAITVQTGDDPCLSCRGCRKCDYRHLGPIGGCEGCLYGSKHKHSDGRRMFRREDYAAHFDECERSKSALAAA